MRLTFDDGDAVMSDQFYYVQLEFIPATAQMASVCPLKIRTVRRYKAVVEVPMNLVERKQSENASGNSRR